MLKLYHGDTSVCAAKVRFALAEKGLDWTGQLLDLSVGDSHTPDYLKLNPNGVVPTLVHDNSVIIESTIINEYVDDAFADLPLRPQDATARARMRLWTKQLDDSIHRAVGIVTFCIAYRFLRLDKPREEIERIIAGYVTEEKREHHRDILFNGLGSVRLPPALQRFQRLLADMDAVLRDDPWLAGGSLSLADIGLAPYIERLDLLHLAFMWDAHPGVADWYSRIRQRPAYQEAIVAWNDAAPAEMKLMDEKGRDSIPTVRDLLATL